MRAARGHILRVSFRRYTKAVQLAFVLVSRVRYRKFQHLEPRGQYSRTADGDRAISKMILVVPALAGRDPNSDKITNTNASPTFENFEVLRLGIWLSMWVRSPEIDQLYGVCR